MERDEVRGAGPASLLCSPRSDGVNASAWGLKLPMLTARPGNVGVQIDSFRTMKMFHRPRCGKFTAQFQGISFESHSLENHARIVERTQLRARIVGERLQKLKDHEAKMVADEQRRRQRRKEREAGEQRHQWLMRQAAKKEEQRQREEQAARQIQRVARGGIARRRVREIKEEDEMHRAARRLQSSLKTFVRKKRTEKRHQEREKERRLQAAKIIQQQVRKRRDSNQVLHSLHVEASVDVAETLVHEASPHSTMPEDGGECPESEPRAEDPPSAEAISPADLSHELSLELLFSIPSPINGSADELHGTNSARPTNNEPIRPRRPVTIKRVGGGFRQSTFQSPRLRTSKPPDLAEAITSPRPQPPQHHQARVPRGRVSASHSKQHGAAAAPEADATRRTAPTCIDEKHLPIHQHAADSACKVPYEVFSSTSDGVASDDDEDTLLDLVQQLDS